MKKTFYHLFSIMAILLGVFSCGDEPEVSPYPPGSKYKRTVMVYMAAQNSLGASGLRDKTVQKWHMACGIFFLESVC